MPLYEYECPRCGNHFEERKSFEAASEPAYCPSCPGEEGIKVFVMPMVISMTNGPQEPDTVLGNPRVDPGRQKWGHMPGCPCCKWS